MSVIVVTSNNTTYDSTSIENLLRRIITLTDPTHLATSIELRTLHKVYSAPNGYIDLHLKLHRKPTANSRETHVKLLTVAPWLYWWRWGETNFLNLEESKPPHVVLTLHVIEFDDACIADPLEQLAYLANGTLPKVFSLQLWYHLILGKKLPSSGDRALSVAYVAYLREHLSADYLPGIRITRPEDPAIDYEKRRTLLSVHRAKVELEEVARLRAALDVRATKIQHKQARLERMLGSSGLAELDTLWRDLNGR